MLRSTATALVLATLGCATALTGCDVKAPMCNDLRQSVESREAMLDRDCNIDEECFVIETLPGRYVAAAEVPADPEFNAAIAAFEADCGVAPVRDRTPNVFDAECRAFQGVETGVRRNLCAVTLDGEIVDPNAPDFVLPPDAICDCSADAECAEREICVAGCLCAPPCEAACINVDLCGETTLLDLGLGSDVETCTEVCEANLTDETLRDVELPCLASATCDVIENCLVGF